MLTNQVKRLIYRFTPTPATLLLGAEYNIKNIASLTLRSVYQSKANRDPALMGSFLTGHYLSVKK